LSFSQLLVRLGTLPTCGTSTSHPGSVVGKSRKSFATRHNGPPATLDRFPSTPAGVGVVPTGLPHAATDVPDPFPAVVGQFFRHSPQSSASQPGGHRPGRLPVSSGASRFLPFIDGRCRCVANAGMGRRFCRFADVGSRLAVVSPGWGSPTGGRPPSSTPVWGPSRRSESPRGCGELFPYRPPAANVRFYPQAASDFRLAKSFSSCSGSPAEPACPVPKWSGPVRWGWPPGAATGTLENRGIHGSGDPESRQASQPAPVADRWGRPRFTMLLAVTRGRPGVILPGLPDPLLADLLHE